MRPASDHLGDILQSSFSRRLIVDVFYDDERVFQNLPVVDYQFAWDLESDLKSSGSLTIAYQGDTGQSLSPTGFTDVLAPYGQQVNVLMEVSLGSLFSETIQIGRFRINETPEASDSYLSFAGRTLTGGSVVKITLDDLLSGVKRAGFRWPSPPILTDSTWDELQRITDLPVNPSVDDKGTPDGLIYEPKDGGRLNAVQMLASYLGGTACTNSFGELTLIPFAAGARVNTLSMGANGRVLSAASSLTSDGLYNEVIGTYQEKDGTPIYSIAEVRTGPLSVEGPFGPYTYYDSSDTVQTQAAADKRTKSVLSQLLAGQTYRITVSCILDPRIEFGDVVDIVSMTGVVRGRVIAYGFGTDGLMNVTVDVRRDVSL